MLFYLDSNQDKQDQNLLCYHYTIEQSLQNCQVNFKRCSTWIRTRTNNLLCYHYTIEQYLTNHQLSC